MMMSHPGKKTGEIWSRQSIAAAGVTLKELSCLLRSLVAAGDESIDFLSNNSAIIIVKKLDTKLFDAMNTRTAVNERTA